MWFAWVAFPLAGVLWVATWYSHHWFYYDEWTTIDRSFDSWTAMFSGHQGHLEIPSYVIYRLQRSWFGLLNHRLVWLAFMASIAAFQVSVAALLTQLRVPALLSLLSAAIITFFGVGGQSVTWEFQLGINFALAATFFAAFVALDPTRTRRTAVAIAALLVVAAISDSGLALFGLLFVSALVVALWWRRWSLMLIALVPAGVVHGAWLLFGDQGPKYSTTFHKIWVFFERLVLLAAGGLVGGGETGSAAFGEKPKPPLQLSGTTVGVIVLVLGAVCVLYAVRRRRLDRVLTVVLIAGVTTAILEAGAISKTRAFLIKPEDITGSRYVQWVAVFMLIALAPVAVAVLRSGDPRRNRIIGGVAAVLLVAVLGVSIKELAPVRRSGEEWGADTKSFVAAAITVINDGCPPGLELDPPAQAIPGGDLAPQITVEVLQKVLRDGALPASMGIAPLGQITRAMCKPVKGG